MTYFGTHISSACSDIAALNALLGFIDLFIVSWEVSFALPHFRGETNLVEVKPLKTWSMFITCPDYPSYAHKINV